MDRSWNSTFAIDEVIALIFVDSHDGSRTEQTTKFYFITDLFTIGRNESGGGGLAVDHTKSHFISDDARDGLFARVTRNGNHIKADRADTSHGF